MALQPEKNQINYGDKLFFMGSCFAENLGEKVQKLGFDAFINPYGILFNPFSIANALEEIIVLKKYTEKDILQHDNYWLSLHHHGSFRNENKAILLEEINAKILEANSYLKQTKFLFITLGTAWSYQYLPSKNIVANCHKIPAKNFEKKLLDLDILETKWNLLLADLKVFNPDLEIIFTVSPVKYLRWGTHENNIGKSVLFLLIHQLQTQNIMLNYFPAFELVQDDLRDYRFYKEDFAHPNNLAIDYIWEKWSEVYLNENTQKLTEEIRKYNLLKAHKVRGNKEEQEIHRQKIEEKFQELKAKNPFIILEVGI